MNRKAKGSAYKMKGYSYPGTSPMKQTDPPVGGEGFSTEGYIEKGEQYKKVKKSKRRNLATDLSARYNTTITKKTDPKTGVKTWSNPEGVSVSELEEQLLVRTKKENIEGKLRN